MDNLTNLYLEMQESQILLAHYNMDCSRTKAATMKMGAGHMLFIDYAQIETLSEELCVVAHEVGHVKTGSTHKIYSPIDLIQRHEYRADKWAANRLLPLGLLRRAFCEGITEVWQLADEFGLTEDFVRRAIYVYRAQGKLA
jgi:hypothetical protein